MPSPRQLVAALALPLLTAVAYAPVRDAGFVWDDLDYVVQNQTLESVDGLRRIWTELDASPQFYPLTFTTLWVEHRLWGDWPAGYHATNVLLHAAASLLLWRLLHVIGAPGAWLAAALFAVHPLHAESVAWVSERKNVLSACLLLASFCVLWNRVLKAPAAEAKRSLGLWWILALVLFLSALLSKSVVGVAPAALMLVVWASDLPDKKRSVLVILPLLAIGISYGFLTAWVEKSHVGAVGAGFEIEFWRRPLIACRAAWFYLGKLMWPSDLCFSYQRWDTNSLGPEWLAWPLLTIGAVAFLWAKRLAWGRWPIALLIAFGVLLSPALGFVDVYPFRFSFVADHFCYLASAPVLAGLVALVTNRFPTLWARVALLVVLTIAVSITHQRVRVYESGLTLWADTIQTNPDSWLARHNLGLALAERDRYPEAIDQYQAAITIDPGEPTTRFNLAIAAQASGDGELAAAQLEKVLDLAPEWVVALNELAWLRATHRTASLRNPKQALRLASRANQLSGGTNPVLLDTLAAALAASGRYEEATKVATRAIRQIPVEEESLADEISLRLELYEQGIAFLQREQRESERQ